MNKFDEAHYRTGPDMRQGPWLPVCYAENIGLLSKILHDL
ncbi:hypothetical protein APS_1862 [Acetobacter pasteurianus subsp. pasteurianus LMG 1262 = NBRC 106471]|nr:hypothetical protein APS_1862 [Acetobacter pasteurianus subsp. pasteurianus LMG 1262 = NBRC 106471]